MNEGVHADKNVKHAVARVVFLSLVSVNQLQVQLQSVKSMILLAMCTRIVSSEYIEMQIPQQGIWKLIYCTNNESAVGCFMAWK